MCVLAGLDPMIGHTHAKTQLGGGGGHCWVILLLEGGELIFVVAPNSCRNCLNLRVVCFFIKPIRNSLNPFYSLWQLQHGFLDYTGLGFFLFVP